MPQFNGFQSSPYVSMVPGESIALFNVEAVAAGYVSQVICRAGIPSGDGAITFDSSFASAPTASVTILGSNFTPTPAGPQNGIVLATITTQNTFYTDTNRFAYYWAVVNSYSAGGPYSLIAKG